jgi:hypothetical protein
MRRREAALDRTIARMTLSKAATCTRSCREATSSMGLTIGATSERPSSKTSTFRSKGNPRVEANHVEPEIAKFMHNPRRHGAGFNPNPRIIARISAHRGANIFRDGKALASPYSPTVLVDNANRRRLLRNVQANKMGHR